jgi:GWxTD domain-containing protein
VPEAAFVCALWIVLGCRTAAAPGLSAELRAWPEGPVRWLLLPEDRRAWARVRSDAEARALIEWFWARREGAAGPGESSFRELFEARVEAADHLYGEGEVRGSLTDRGRALILLGAPSYIQLTHRPALAWDPKSVDRRMVSREIRVEVWGYAPENLLPWVRQAILGAREGLPPEISFVAEPPPSHLEKGEDLLELAARALAGAARD